MPHLRSAGIGAFGHKRDSQNLLAVITGDPQGIPICIVDVLFFDPKEFFTFRTFSDKHGHQGFPG